MLEKERDAQPSMFSEMFKDQFTIVLIRGKNAPGDQIYAYMRCNIDQLKRLNAVFKSDIDFSLTDYGTIIAAGRGEPPPELKAEIDKAFPGMVSTPGTLFQGKNYKAPKKPDAPKEKKP